MKLLKVFTGAAALTFSLLLPLGAQVFTLDVRAYIDGKDDLIIAGNTLQWHHLDFAAVGRHNGQNEPTTISTTLNSTPVLSDYQWTPTWPDPVPNEIRYEAYSSVFSDLAPALPAQPMAVSLDVISARYQIQLIQWPSVGNGFTTILEFDDDPYGEPDYYEAQLTFATVPEPATTYLLGGGLLLLVSGLCRQRHFCA